MPSWAPDAITREVMDLVRTRYPQSLGTVDGFAEPVTAADALRAADDFFAHRLASFGPFEDAMVVDEPDLFHSRLSPALNLGLLDPLGLCQRADASYRAGAVPLASAEGFIRQILGWREFVRHVYEEDRTLYATTNALDATLPLPSWYWGERSGLHCLDTTVAQVLATGYSHHITRLMVLSNIATLLGVDPHALNHWFWVAYLDAYEWVVTPNVVGMATYADGGRLGGQVHPAHGAVALCRLRLRSRQDDRAACVPAEPPLLGLPRAAARAARAQHADAGAARGAATTGSRRHGGASGGGSDVAYGGARGWWCSDEGIDWSFASGTVGLTSHDQSTHD